MKMSTASNWYDKGAKSFSKSVQRTNFKTINYDDIEEVKPKISRYSVS